MDQIRQLEVKKRVKERSTCLNPIRESKFENYLSNNNYGPFEENMGRGSIILRPPHAFR